MAFERLKSENTLDTVMDAAYALSSSIFACTVSCSVWISWWFTQWAVVTLLYKIYNVIRKRESLFEFNKKSMIFCLFCLMLFFFALSSSLWAKDPDVAFSFSHKKMSPLAMIVVLILAMPKRVPVKLLLQSYIVGSFLFVFNDLYAVIKNGLEHDVKFFYYYGTNIKSVIIECWERHINHVYTGPTLMSAFFVIFYLLKTYKNSIYEKILYVSYILIAFPFILFDCSRACILGFLISLVLLVLTYSKLSIKKLSLMILGLMVLFGVLMLIPSRFSESVIQLLVNHQFNDPRIYVWDSLIKAADKVPFLGYGASNQLSHYYDAYIANGQKWCATSGFGSHNQFIGFFYELGFIGLALFLCVIVSYIIIFVRKSQYRVITLPFIAMFIVSSCFDNAMQSFYATMGLMFFPFICSVKEEKQLETPKQVYIAVEMFFLVFVIWCGVSVYRIVDYIKSDPSIVISDLRHFRLRRSQIRRIGLSDELASNIYYFVSSSSYTDMWYESYYKFSSMIARVKSGSKHKLSFDYYVSEDYSGYKIKISTQRTSNFTSIKSGNVTEMSNPPYSTSNFINVKEREKWKHFEVTINGGEQYIRLEIPKSDAYMIHRMKGYIIIKNLKIEKK